jgi:N,N-dimethylformamidase
MPITGYFDQLSARPGETLTAYVSVADGAEYSARLVRVISGDPNPAGPGMIFEDLSGRFERRLQGRRQPLTVGSFGDVGIAPALPPDLAVTWSALVWFCAHPEDKAAIVSQASPEASVSLFITAGGLRAELAHDGRDLSVELSTRLKLNQWTRVWLSVDPIGARVVLGCRQRQGARACKVTALPTGFAKPTGGRLTIAAAGDPASHHFTGKVERPGVYAGVWQDCDHRLAIELEPLAEWDFSRGIDTQTIVGVGPEARDGVLHHLPTRAVAGAGWTGEEHAWRHAPQEYAAIHFHEDDFGSCDWDAAFAFEIPGDLNSGCYALHLRTAAGEDWLPFYVLPARARPRADVVFLAPTYTYQAYANCYFANRTEDTQSRNAAWGGSIYSGRRYGSYGRSTYNWHADGSGVCLSSRHRPILTMRPGFIFADDAKGSGLRHYPADTHLLAWLEAKGISFDVVTDEDLDNEGIGLIRDYKCVLTGSHPEYHTAGTLDALQAYVDSGGHLAYLGGNGFYWRIARNPKLPEVIEVRRAEGGIRTWAAAAGEYYHQLDGRLGGIWRRSGRLPQALVGIGFSAQGPFDAGHYRRKPDSYDGPGAWIFEDVVGEIVGDYGLSAGGAAGFELDRADPDLGAPGEIFLLATSENVPSSFGVVHEEMLTEALTVSGERPEALVRADMVYVETPSGGGIFSTGSITFCGSLWNGQAFAGPISQILENVVRRFSAG